MALRGRAGGGDGAIRGGEAQRNARLASFPAEVELQPERTSQADLALVAARRRFPGGDESFEVVLIWT